MNVTLIKQTKRHANFIIMIIFDVGNSEFIIIPLG